MASLKRSPAESPSKVSKVSGESRGEVVRDVQMNVDEVTWQEECNAIREESVPVIRLHVVLCVGQRIQQGRRACS